MFYNGRHSQRESDRALGGHFQERRQGLPPAVGLVVGEVQDLLEPAGQFGQFRGRRGPLRTAVGRGRHWQPGGPGRIGEPAVVGHKGSEPVADVQRRGQVDGIQAPHRDGQDGSRPRAASSAPPTISKTSAWPAPHVAAKLTTARGLFSAMTRAESAAR